MAYQVDKIQADEFHFLIESNLKKACEIEDFEMRKKHLVRALELMAHVNKMKDSE